MGFQNFREVPSNTCRRTKKKVKALEKTSDDSVDENDRNTDTKEKRKKKKVTGVAVKKKKSVEDDATK